MVFRIFKMIVTSGFLTVLECTIFVFDRGSAPDPTGSSPDLLAYFRGPVSNNEGGRENGREGRE